MRLLSVHWSSFPQLKLVESVGNAPTSTCLQGKCIACLPRPHKKLASRPDAAPGKLSFGNSAAQAGARLVWKLVRLPGIAPGHAPWREAILLLNHNREIKRAGSVIAPPAHAISIKNKHLLVIYSIPTRGFTAAVSVFMGTPPAKPLICKIRFALADDAIDPSWAHHTGDDSKLVLAKFNLSSEDIIKMSRCSCSQIIRLSLRLFIPSVPQGK
jgi:hypothetical protein